MTIRRRQPLPLPTGLRPMDMHSPFLDDLRRLVHKHGLIFDGGNIRDWANGALVASGVRWNRDHNHYDVRWE